MGRECCLAIAPLIIPPFDNQVALPFQVVISLISCYPLLHLQIHRPTCPLFIHFYTVHEESCSRIELCKCIAATVIAIDTHTHKAQLQTNHSLHVHTWHRAQVCNRSTACPSHSHHSFLPGMNRLSELVAREVKKNEKEQLAELSILSGSPYAHP